MSELSLDDIDLTDMDRFAESFPHEWFTLLRHESPVWWHEPTPEIIGVPMSDRKKLFDWTNAMVGSTDPEYVVADDDVANAQVEMFTYANDLAVEKRAKPTDDIVTAILNAEVDGERLDELEFDL